MNESTFTWRKGTSYWHTIDFKIGNKTLTGTISVKYDRDGVLKGATFTMQSLGISAIKIKSIEIEDMKKEVERAILKKVNDRLYEFSEIKKLLEGNS